MKACCCFHHSVHPPLHTICFPVRTTLKTFWRQNFILAIFYTSRWGFCLNKQILSLGSSGILITTSCCKCVKMCRLLLTVALIGYQNLSSTKGQHLRYPWEKILEKIFWLSYQVHFEGHVCRCFTERDKTMCVNSHFTTNYNDIFTKV